MAETMPSPSFTRNPADPHSAQIPCVIYKGRKCRECGRGFAIATRPVK